jgi:putative DNA primase/helicase
MFHAKAPSISSGKSYLCELFTAFATPQKGTPHAFPADDEECRKLLLAELLTAPAVVEFDNLTGDLVPHKSLCTTLTSEYISGRILGQSKTAEVGTRALFLSSGNNVDPVRDMTRRVVTITLDPACETPAARDFRKQPVSEVRADRGRFVSLALTIVRAWICADRPKTACKTIASYADWSDYCRQPLLWLGLPDPAACIFEAMNDDPDRELLGEILQVWHEKFGKAPALVKLVNKLANSVIDQYKYPHSHKDDALEAQIKALIAAELEEKVPTIKTISSP